MTVYLITGASSGIGLELVKQLCGIGDNTVFATVRKKESSMSGQDEISSIAPVSGSNLHILENIDVSSDSVGEVLIPLLNGTVIDVVVHNAGSLSGTREVESSNLMAEQNFDAVTMERMRKAFEVNTLGPLRVQQAILSTDLMKIGGSGKVAIISTGLSSISDNTSGGNYAYRTSKAGVNMVAKCMSCDLKDKGISVISIAPGFVATEFGPGKEKMKSWGAMEVSISCRGIISLLESMTMENTGTFFSVKKDGSTKEFPW